jgi:hypothetical protein
MMAAFAAAASFHWARALANAACPAGADGDGVGDAVGPDELTAVADAEMGGAVVVAAAAVVEVDAVSACCVLGAATGWLAPALLHAATVKIVATSTPVTGRNRSLFMPTQTRELGVWLGCSRPQVGEGVVVRTACGDVL